MGDTAHRRAGRTKNMVNTRILEQQLGWRRNKDQTEDANPAPQSRQIGHDPVLRGRVRAGGGGARMANRRPETDALWAELEDISATPALRSATAAQFHALDPDTPAGSALDQMRMQLLRALRDKGWRRVGVSSPSHGCGRSFMAAGLAASLARLDYLNVALVDLDLENPGLSRALHPGAPSIEALLDGDSDVLDHAVRLSPNLAFLANGTAVANAAAYAQNADFARGFRAVLDELAPDVVIADLPPVLGNALGPVLLDQMDGVLLIADGTQTTARGIADCERIIEGHVPLLGVILNKSEDPDPRALGGARVSR
jgi:Mrp family chromosome partitioning ATPase